MRTESIVDPGASVSGLPSIDPGRPADSPVRDSDRPNRGRTLGWFAVAAVTYLVLAIGLFWHVWSGGPSTTTLCGCGDPSLFVWFLNWPAYAIAHGLDPFYSTALGYPHGVNLLANTSDTAIGIALAPVTWIFGPVVTLNVALTLAPVLSALAMFFLLRRWVVWTPAALVGGLLYGFAPFMVISLSSSWLMLGFAAVPPLILAVLDEILFRRRWSQTRSGIVLGVLVALQFFLGSELLLILALGIAVGLVLLAAYGALTHTLDLGAGVAGAPYGLGVGVATAIVLLAVPAGFALGGPAHFSGLVWTITPSSFGKVNSLAATVVAPAASSTVHALNHLTGGYQGPVLSMAYIGPGVLAVAVFGLVVFRRDRRIWLACGVTAVALALAAGTRPDYWTPWRLFANLPLIENIWPVRIDFLMVVCAAVVVGLVMDDAHRAIGRRTARRSRLAATAGWAIALVALLPLAIYLSSDVPLTTTTVVTPTWFTAQGEHLHGRQVVLTVPFTYYLSESPMTWQVQSGMHFSLVGQGGPGGWPARMGVEEPGAQVLSTLSLCCAKPPVARYTADQVMAVRYALRGWGTTMVVIPDEAGLPRYDHVTSVPLAVSLITAATGMAPTRSADAWVWSGVDTDPALASTQAAPVPPVPST